MNVKGLALLAAAAVAVGSAKSPERSANVSTAVLPEANSTSINELYRLIQDNPELQNLLRGQKGDKGDTGATGASGSHGQNGESVQNYGGSLIRGGALETGTLDGWSGTAVALASETFQGMPVIQGTTGNNSSYVYVQTDKLYKAEYYVKGSGNHSLFATIFDRSNVTAPKTNSSFGSYFKFSVAMNPTFTKTVGYIGGVGVNNMHLSDNTVKMKVSFLGHGSVLVSIAKLIVKEVPLGEPVPYNLPYLPTNQVVYDPTTGELGMYNGTAVVWTT